MPKKERPQPSPDGRYYYKKDGHAAYNIKEPLENILDDITGYERITPEEWEALTAVPVYEPTAEELHIKEVNEEIATLKRHLADTDYIALKLAEALAKNDVDAVASILSIYEAELANREAWRARINELEVTL